MKNNTQKTRKNTKLKKKSSWDLTHPPTSEFFSDFWIFFNLTRPLTDFPNLNPPSSVTENVNQDRINVGPLPIEKQTNESCDVNKLIN